MGALDVLGNSVRRNSLRILVAGKRAAGTIVDAIVGGAIEKCNPPHMLEVTWEFCADCDCGR